MSCLGCDFSKITKELKLLLNGQLRSAPHFCASSMAQSIVTDHGLFPIPPTCPRVPLANFLHLRKDVELREVGGSGLVGGD